MGVSNAFKHVLRFSFLAKRNVRKGKRADYSAPSLPIAVTVHCGNDGVPEVEEDDFSEGLFDAQMAVKETMLGLHPLEEGSSSSSSSRTRLVRIVSWANILGDHTRWTIEQERELAVAQSQLARCQKAWSSEQELWLAYIKALNEEKEAHQEFLNHRAKQQDDEQQHFRKAWNRRKSYEEQHRSQPSRTNSRLHRLQRRTSSFGQEE